VGLHRLRFALDERFRYCRALISQLRRDPGQTARSARLASLLIIASAWNYQPVSLFYLVFVSVKVVRRGQWAERASRTRLFQHLLLLGASLLIAYVLIRVSFATDLLPMSKRIAFDLDPLGKLVWFARNVVRTHWPCLSSTIFRAALHRIIKSPRPAWVVAHCRWRLGRKTARLA